MGIDLSPVYTTENFSHGSGEIGTGAKRSSANFVYTTPFLPYRKYHAKNFGPASVLLETCSSIRSKDGRQSLFAVSLKKDVSQSLKLNYGHRSWQKRAGKNLLP